MHEDRSLRGKDFAFAHACAPMFDPNLTHATMHVVQTALLGTVLQERGWGVDRTGEFEFLLDLIVKGLA
jgi:hypothetical protein